MQTVKNLIRKAKDSHEDPYLSILNFRTTPKSEGKSPAEILMGRKLTTLLPQSDAIKIAQNKVGHCEKQKSYYDMHAKDMTELQKGDFVRYRNNATKTWEPAQIVEKLDFRSYVIKTSTGTYRRNRRSLMKTSESDLICNLQFQLKQRALASKLHQRQWQAVMRIPLRHRCRAVVKPLLHKHIRPQTTHIKLDQAEL